MHMKADENKPDNLAGEGEGEASSPMSDDFMSLLEEEIDVAGGEWQEDEESRGSVGFTMYDAPTSKDNTVTVLLPADQIGRAPSQSLVRIKSKAKERGGDGRQY